MSKKKRRPNQNDVPAAPSEYITIPVAEYMYLQRLDAVLAMRMAGKEGGEE